jgi:translation initiation factor 6
MSQAKATFYGNSFLSLFCKTNDSLTLLPKNTPEKFKSLCNEVLKTKIVHTSIASSDLLGIFSAMNSNAILLPTFISENEKKEIKSTGLNVVIMEGKHYAIGNNVLVNDNGCIINPNMDSNEKKQIEDCFGVEVIEKKIAGYNTVGSACIVTNKGFLAKNDAGDEEIKFLEEFFKVKGGIGTANLGVSVVGLCAIANSNGLIAGELTSGFEMQRIIEALGFL